MEMGVGDARGRTFWALHEYNSRRERMMRASGPSGSTVRSGSARVWSGVRPEALGFSLELETTVVLTKIICLGLVQ
jgi:hypothetical protein